jgi:ATP-dependent DNA helicase RecG
MFEEMRAAGLVDPIYRQSSASVHLTLSTEVADRALEARLPSYSRMIIGSLREAGRLSTGDIVELLPMSRPAALRRLHALEDAGLIEWFGKSPQDPRAYWALRPSELSQDDLSAAGGDR